MRNDNTVTVKLTRGEVIFLMVAMDEIMTPGSRSETIHNKLKSQLEENEKKWSERYEK